MRFFSLEIRQLLYFLGSHFIFDETEAKVVLDVQISLGVEEDSECTLTREHGFRSAPAASER